MIDGSFDSENKWAPIRREEVRRKRYLKSKISEILQLVDLPQGEIQGELRVFDICKEFRYAWDRRDFETLKSLIEKYLTGFSSEQLKAVVVFLINTDFPNSIVENRTFSEIRFCEIDDESRARRAESKYPDYDMYVIFDVEDAPTGVFDERNLPSMLRDRLEFLYPDMTLEESYWAFIDTMRFAMFALPSIEYIQTYILKHVNQNARIQEILLLEDEDQKFDLIVNYQREICRMYADRLINITELDLLLAITNHTIQEILQIETSRNLGLHSIDRDIILRMTERAKADGHWDVDKGTYDRFIDEL